MKGQRLLWRVGVTKGSLVQRNPDPQVSWDHCQKWDTSRQERYSLSIKSLIKNSSLLTSQSKGNNNEGIPDRNRRRVRHNSNCRSWWSYQTTIIMKTIITMRRIMKKYDWNNNDERAVRDEMQVGRGFSEKSVLCAAKVGLFGLCGVIQGFVSTRECYITRHDERVWNPNMLQSQNQTDGTAPCHLWCNRYTKHNNLGSRTDVLLTWNNGDGEAKGLGESSYALITGRGERRLIQCKDWTDYTNNGDNSNDDDPYYHDNTYRERQPQHLRTLVSKLQQWLLRVLGANELERRECQ